MTSDFSKRVRASARLTLSTTLINGGLQALTLLVLARLLGPAEYGIYAIALAVSMMTTGLCLSVLEAALVLDNAAAERRIDRSIVASVFFVAVLTLVAVTAANEFFGTGLNMTVLTILLVAQVCSSVAVGPRVRLRATLKYGPISQSEFLGQILGSTVVPIALASARFGAKALAIGTLVQALVIVLVLRRGDAQLFKVVHSKWTSNLTSNLFGLASISVLERAHAQAGPLIIGAQLGVSPLGLFNRTYNIVQLPVQMISTSLTRVMVSGLVSVSDQSTRFERGAAALVRLTNATVAPVLAGIALSDRAFVAVLLGERWGQVNGFVAILCAATFLNVMSHLFAIVAEAKRAFVSKIQVQGIALVTLVIAVFLGSKSGLKGAAIGLVTAQCLYAILYLVLTCRMLRIKPHVIATWLKPGLGGAFACAVGCAIAGLLPIKPTSVGELFIKATFGSVCTVAYYLVSERNVTTELLQALLPSVWSKRILASVYREPSREAGL